MPADLFCLPECEPEVKRSARFMERCEATEFTPDQYLFLLALAKDQRGNADSAAAMSAMVAGMAVNAAPSPQ
jgi:hypothetical protein